MASKAGMRFDLRLFARVPLRTALATASVALTAGCADLFSPAGAPAVFALHTLNEQPLPAVVGEAGPFSVMLVEADSLVVSASGTATWIRHARLELDAGGPIRSRFETTVELIRDGAGIRVAAPGWCAAMPSCHDMTVLGPAQLPDEFVLTDIDGARRYRRGSRAPNKAVSLPAVAGRATRMR